MSPGLAAGLAPPSPDPAAAWPDPRGRGQVAAAGVADLRGRLAAAEEARAALSRRLEAALEVRREALRQGEALDEMRRRLELRRARAEEALAGNREALQGVERRKEQLQTQIGRVMPLSRAVAAAHRHVQEAKVVLSAEKARLGNLQRLLRMRQRCMVGQVAALYPVKVFHDPPHAENHGSDTNGEHGAFSEENGTLSEGNGARGFGVIKYPRLHALSFFGWQTDRRKQKSYNEKELQRSAAVLGYAVHAVLLIASYLDVPLRYPLRFGGSRSYVSDCLPSAGTASVASAQHSCINSTDPELREYPLFLECQVDNSTRASSAIYLLHKDTEQLLNYIGTESSGREVFGNLRKLIRTIQSDEYVYR